MYHGPLSTSPLVKRKEVLTKVGQEDRWAAGGSGGGGGGWLQADKQGRPTAGRGRRAAANTGPAAPADATPFDQHLWNTPAVPDAAPLAAPPPMPPLGGLTPGMPPLQPAAAPLYSPGIAYPASVGTWSMQPNVVPMPYSMPPQPPPPFYNYAAPPAPAPAPPVNFPMSLPQQGYQPLPPPVKPRTPPPLKNVAPYHDQALGGSYQQSGGAKHGRRRAADAVGGGGGGGGGGDGFLWRLGMGTEENERHAAKERQRDAYRRELEEQIRDKQRATQKVPHHMQHAQYQGHDAGMSPSVGGMGQPTAPGERTGRDDHSYSKLRAQVLSDQEVTRIRHREEQARQLQLDLEVQIDEKRRRKEEDDRKRKESEERWNLKYGNPDLAGVTLPQQQRLKTDLEREKEKVSENQAAQSQAAAALMNPKFAPLKKVYHHQKSHPDERAPPISPSPPPPLTTGPGWLNDGTLMVGGAPPSTTYDAIEVGGPRRRGMPIPGGVPHTTSPSPPPPMQLEPAAVNNTPFVDSLEELARRKEMHNMATGPGTPPPPPAIFKEIPRTEAVGAEERFREQDERMTELDAYIPLHNSPLLQALAHPPPEIPQSEAPQVEVTAYLNNDEIARMSKKNRTRLRALHDISEKIESPSCSKSEADLLLQNFAADAPQSTTQGVEATPSPNPLAGTAPHHSCRTPIWLQGGASARSAAPSPLPTSRLPQKTPVMPDLAGPTDSLPCQSSWVGGAPGLDGALGGGRGVATVGGGNGGIVLDPISRYAGMGYDELPAWLREDEGEEAGGGAAAPPAEEITALSLSPCQGGGGGGGGASPDAPPEIEVRPPSSVCPAAGRGDGDDAPLAPPPEEKEMGMEEEEKEKEGEGDVSSPVELQAGAGGGEAGEAAGVDPMSQEDSEVLRVTFPVGTEVRLAKGGRAGEAVGRVTGYAPGGLLEITSPAGEVTESHPAELLPGEEEKGEEVPGRELGEGGGEGEGSAPVVPPVTPPSRPSASANPTPLMPDD